MEWRVLQLGPYPPPYGGVQTHVVALRRFLLERGIACDVINITRRRGADDAGVHYPATALASRDSCSGCARRSSICTWAAP